MNIRIELADDLPEEECIIRCREVDARISRIEKLIRRETAFTAPLTFYKRDEEFFFSVSDVLFFETEGDRVYAHTAKDMFFVRQRLNELERTLPRPFVRAAKSVLLNVRHVYSIQKNITASSLVQFTGSHKQVYLSRLYYKECRQRVDEERSKT